MNKIHVSTGSGAFTVGRWKHGRFWAIHAATGELVCLCVYKKGAEEVVRRLSASCNEGGMA